MYYDLYLPNCGQDGVLVIRKAGQQDWYKSVQIRGIPYTDRTGNDDGLLWKVFDSLYPSKTSQLMADLVATIGPDQGPYSKGLGLVTAIFDEDKYLPNGTG